MAEPPSRKPKVPRRKELQESYKSLEEAAARRHRRDVELFEVAQKSKFEAENRQGSGSRSVISGEPIEHSPLLPPAAPSPDFAFGFNFDGLSPSPMRSPDAVGINGLSSGVTTSGYLEPGSSSEPPRPTSRRSAFEEERERLAFEAATEHSASEGESEHSALEEELNHSAMEEEKRKDLALEEDRDRSAFEASQRGADEEVSQQPAFEEERKNMAFGAFAEERKNRESFDSPPEELHKIIQVNDPAHEEGDIKPSPKVYLQFSALTYTVCKKPSRWQRLKGMVLPGLKATRPPPKQLRLLDGISGEARDGEILAVMGPSGSGKSTLIDALAQRIDAVKGTMTLNGNYFSERLLRNISAYVMQDDLLYPMLTVKETLLFSAFFRLPPSQSKATKVARVNNLLDQLGLVRVANIIIGDEGHRGVSGGERRRVSIGIDIIHDPLILFLDEPTSGLDSTSAYLVVRTLQKIAQTGSLVILSIHQPSYRIMGLFDHLIILAFGEKVYGGRPLDLNLFFEEFGRPVPKHENSTEHALDLIQELHASQEGIAPLVEFCRSWEARSQPSMPMQAMQNFPDANAAMSSVLQNEKLLASKGSSPKMENSSASTSGWLHHMHAKSDAETVCTFANPWWAEVVVLVRRSWKNIQRTPELFLMRLVTVLVTGFILATIFWHLDATPLGVQERLGFFAFAMSTTYYTCADALPVFLQERYIFMRETTTNAYRKSSYVLAHAIIYVPFLAILSMGYCIIIWWAVGLAGGGSGFLFLFLIVWASFWAGNSFVTLLSAIMPNVMVGYTITVAMLAYFLLLSGFFISRLRIPWYWRWFHYISIIKYPYEAVLLNEFGKTKSCFEIGRQLFHGTPLANLNDQIIDGILGYIRSLPALRKTPYAQLDSTSCILTGHDILINKEIVELNKWKCLGITVAFGIVFRYAFYIVIRITGKNKRD